jgi:hypothetical protein
MNGALMRASSRFAIAAALGLVVGVSSARAADLGGNCCADLEERIAELEATTARKGNRKMSLTISGQVHRAIVWWDDGFSSKTYYGVDNTNSSSRFIFSGSAKVTPKVSMGFEIMIEIEAGGTSSKLSQFDEDGKVGGQISGSAAPAVSFNAHNVDAYMGDARHVAWWIEHADLGRITAGRWESAGVLGTIDITGGNVFLPAPAAVGLVMGAAFVRGNTGQYYALPFFSGGLGDPADNNPGRTELVRYDSPSYHGFIYSASINEAGDYWGMMGRYANEFHGFRVAATIGYEKVHDRSTPATVDPTSVNFTGPMPDITAAGISLSAMHVSTGLFVQGHWEHVDFGPTGLQGVTNGYWGSAGQVSQKPADYWQIQAGIAKNWFGYGLTTLYGEYNKLTDWGAADQGRNFAGTTATNCPAINAVCSPTIANFVSVNGVVNTELQVWGVGITQNFDAAATTVYVGYRHYDPDVLCTGGITAQGACAGPGGSLPAHKLPTEGFDLIQTGARVLF